MSTRRSLKEMKATNRTETIRQEMNMANARLQRTKASCGAIRRAEQEIRKEREDISGVMLNVALDSKRRERTVMTETDRLFRDQRVVARRRLRVGRDVRRMEEAKKRAQNESRTFSYE